MDGQITAKLLYCCIILLSTHTHTHTGTHTLTQTIVVIVDIQTHKYAGKSPTHLFNNKCRHKHSDIFSKTIYNPVRSMCVAVQKGVKEKCGMGGSWRQKT